MEINGYKIIQNPLLTKVIFTKKNPRPKNKRYVKKYLKKYSKVVADTNHLIVMEKIKFMSCHPILYKKIEKAIKDLPQRIESNEMSILANMWQPPGFEYIPEPLTMKKLDKDLDNLVNNFGIPNDVGIPLPKYYMDTLV
jgi:hypothetical protein